jgi:hypothetical protein
MQRLLMIAVSWLCGSAMATAQDKQPEAVEIPLKEIWAFNMPGTHDVRELEPDKFGAALANRSSREQLRIMRQSLTSQILSRVQFNKPGQKAARGFTVVGNGADALREAHAVIADRKMPRESFPAGSDLSAVFFSHEFGYYVHVQKVEREADRVTIWYRFVPHETKELTRHFALIPLGSFSPGEVQVEIKRSLDKEGRGPDTSAESRVVAQSFRFQVKADND